MSCWGCCRATLRRRIQKKKPQSTASFLILTLGNQSKREREVKAADRIFNILPKDQAQKLRQLWEEFEAYETPEAKFAHVCDNVQPLMLNDATDGLAWREHDVKKSQVLQRNRRTGEGSQVLMEYINRILDKNVESGNLRDE